MKKQKTSRLGFFAKATAALALGVCISLAGLYELSKRTAVYQNGGKTNQNHCQESPSMAQMRCRLGIHAQIKLPEEEACRQGDAK